MIRKNATGYEVVVYLGVIDGRKQRVSRTARTKKEALALETRLKNDVLDGKRKPAPRRTFADLLDRWLESADLAPSTRYNYGRVIAMRLKPALGTARLTSLTPESLDRLYHKLRKDGLSPRSVRNVHAVARSACAQGVRWGWLSTNPALLASPGRIRATETRVPEVSDIAKVLAAGVADQKTADADLQTIVWVAATTGARRGELCGLQWGDVDFEHATVTIRRAVTDAGGIRVVASTKTSQTRCVALDDVSVQMLKAMRLRTAERLLKLGTAVSDQAFIYANDVTGSQPIAPGVLSNRFRALCRKAGVTMGLHGLRHAAATQLVAGGTDIRTVAARLGHSDPSMTLKVYSHAVMAADRRAADALSDLLRPSESA